MSAMALEHAPRTQAEQAISHAESYLRGEGAPAAPVNTFLPHRSLMSLEFACVDGTAVLWIWGV
jgi:hypothetical protein